MPDEIRFSQEKLDKISHILSPHLPPYIDLSDEAIARIMGGLSLQSTQSKQRLHDSDVPDCLIWDIDTPI